MNKFNLEEAIKLINDREDCKVTKVSNYCDTGPGGFADQYNFVNCAFELKTLLSHLN